MVESAARPLDRNGDHSLRRSDGDHDDPGVGRRRVRSDPARVGADCPDHLQPAVAQSRARGADAGAVPFITVAVARLVLTDPFFYWFGRRYGDVAIRWMEQQARIGRGHRVVARAVLRADELRRGRARSPTSGSACSPARRRCACGCSSSSTSVGRSPGSSRSGCSATCSPIRCSRSTTGSASTASNSRSLTFAIVVVGVWRSMRKGEHPIETPAELAEELAAAERDEAE